MSEIFAKGKRGLIFLEKYQGKNIIVKAKNPKSTTPGRIEIEAGFLKKLNKVGIGPKFLFFKEDQLGMEYIEGILFPEFLEIADKKSTINVIHDLFRQLAKMDELGINKEEMHHPYKHIIVTKDNRPVLIDFERCNHTSSPKNVTQFLQYLSSDRIVQLLEKKGVKVKKAETIDLARQYKDKKLEINIILDYFS